MCFCVVFQRKIVCLVLFFTQFILGGLTNSSLNIQFILMWYTYWILWYFINKSISNLIVFPLTSQLYNNFIIHRRKKKQYQELLLAIIDHNLDIAIKPSPFWQTLWSKNIYDNSWYFFVFNAWYTIIARHLVQGIS